MTQPWRTTKKKAAKKKTTKKKPTKTKPAKKRARKRCDFCGATKSSNFGFHDALYEDNGWRYCGARLCSDALTAYQKQGAKPLRQRGICFAVPTGDQLALFKHPVAFGPRTYFLVFIQQNKGWMAPRGWSYGAAFTHLGSKKIHHIHDRKFTGGRKRARKLAATAERNGIHTIWKDTRTKESTR